MEAKPKLVFFRWPRPDLPHFVQQHLREQAACLEHHFDVVLVSEACDYAEVCERHRPDITLFESGIYAGDRRITNTQAFPEIPKLGFCNADAYCSTRAVFLSDMERWGVETFFTLSASMPEYTPDIADRLFIWPNFVDPAVYRDYGQPKVVPVLFTGSRAAHYPWRSRVHTLVSQRFPSLTTPHAGWFDQGISGRMVVGERYARLLNASLIAPTCGTISREVIRKHFEIPAARTLLVTERTPALEAAGFDDMENVVFAEAGDVVEKIDHLLSHPDELQRITDAGHALVHARHTMAQRDQLRQWYELNRVAQPGQRVVQDGPFAPLRLATGAGNSPPPAGAVDRVLLREGEQLLAAGRLEQAERRFLRALNYHFMPEPVLGLARRRLLGGDAAGAAGWVIQAIERGSVEHGAADPDPVEWAYLVRALLCQGRLADAVAHAERYPSMTHTELERIRAVTASLAGSAAPVPVHAPRASVHVLPALGAPAWTEELCHTLRACGQDALAAAVEAGTRAPEPPQAAGTAPAPEPARMAPLSAEPRSARLKRRVRQALRTRWRGLVADAPHTAVRALVEKEDAHSALLIGASATARCTRAVLAGLRTNPNMPEVVWLHDATPVLLPGRGRRPGERLSEPDALAGREDPFDVVVVGERPPEGPARDAVDDAQVVVLTGINRAPAQRLHS